MYICIIDTIIACCTIQIITDGVNEERAQQGDQFQQGAESYHHDSFDQQGGDGDGFDKWMMKKKTGKHSNVNKTKMVLVVTKLVSVYQT